MSADLDLVSDAVENLVTQFSSALDFYRELVQNSIDAGSDAVDVWLEFIPDSSGGGRGTIGIHVDDFGEGMNEAIIDDQLTRLFSSTKENDLTKIGKFGIGFVSVFAMKPKAVIVHTGRGGEFWEIMFGEDRSFTKARVDTPVDGTQITLYLSGDRASYRELVGDTQRTLAHWCGHSDVEVTFEDRSSDDGSRSINAAFEVEGLCAMRHEVEGTEMAVAYDVDPVYGFYNKGLALAVLRPPDDAVSGRFRHVRFKIKSRYLEHTLARETVMRDGNFERAMAQLRAVADGPLRQALFTAARARAGRPPPWGPGDIHEYLELLGFVAAEAAGDLEQVRSIPLLRTLEGQTHTLDEAWEAIRESGYAYVADQPSQWTRALRAEGTPVYLDVGPQLGAESGVSFAGPVAKLIRGDAYARMRSGVMGYLREKLGDLSARASDLVVRPADVLIAVEVLEDETHPAARLVARAQAILDATFQRGVRVNPVGSGMARELEVRLGYSRLAACRLAVEVDDRPLFVLGRRVGPTMARPAAGAVSFDAGPRPAAAVNWEHPEFRELLSAAETAPEMAAYCLAKALLLHEDWALGKDLSLMRAAIGGAA